MSVNFQRTDQLTGEDLGHFRARMANLLAVQVGARPLPHVQSAAARLVLPPEG